MAVRVAVLDPLPMFARGLVATLAEDGLEPDSPDDVVPWLKSSGQPAVLLALAEPPDWKRLEEIVAVRPDALIIAIVRVTDTDAFRRALASGAVAVLPRDASAALVRQTVRAVLGGRALVPIDVLRALAAGERHTDQDTRVSAEEIRWLRQLAAGSTVARLAASVGYSERMMYRLLSGVYSRIGATSRTQAIVRARDEGWL